jgi:polyhydroxybutyrate depolymerase
MNIFRVIITGLVFLSFWFSAEAAIQTSKENKSPSDLKGSLVFQEHTRTYLLHLPSQLPKTPLPLVIVMHGGGGNAENAIRMTQMNPKSDQEGSIVVYPNGSGRFEDKLLTWNAWNCCGYALQEQIDDVGFIRALIEKLEREYSIDSKRIYATGLSNGGMMAYRLGCELSDKIAAIAPVAGALNTDHPKALNPISVIIFHGTADEHVLYEGGRPKKTMERSSRIDKPVAYAVNFWVTHNQCSQTPKNETEGSIIKESYSGGKNGTEVVLYTIQDQGHAWPGGEKGRRFGNVDKPTNVISATDLIWEFFKKHPKK